MTESIRNLSVGLGLESSLIVTKLLPFSLQPRTEINGQNTVFLKSTCTWTMCIMKNIFVINSNHGSNSKLFKFGKKESWCISATKRWGMPEIWEGGGNCHVVKDCCYPLPVNSKLTIWQLMSFLLQELYNLYLHLTNKFNLNMTTLYFFVNFFYLHLLEDKKNSDIAGLLSFVCYAMQWFY